MRQIYCTGISMMMNNQAYKCSLTLSVLTMVVGLAACQSEDYSTGREEWDEYVVHEESVKGYTLDIHSREFAGRTLIQLNPEELATTVAKLETHQWDDEFISRWSKSIHDDALREQLWKDMPTPDHCWILDHETGVAIYSGATAWSNDCQTVLVDTITGSLRHVRTVRRKLTGEKPEWWPNQYALSEYRDQEYGNVVSGQDAVYYLSSGKVAPSGQDAWGEILKYDGPGKFVIVDAGIRDPQIAIYTLDIQDTHSGLTVMLSSDGRWAVVTAVNDNKIWLLNLTNTWDAFGGERVRKQQSKSIQEDGK